MFLAYARVSTLDQDQPDKISISAQLARCQAVAKARGETGKYGFSTYADRGISGSVPLSERPEGAKMLAAANKGDIVCASKLDRIFRSASDALQAIEKLKRKGVGVIICDIGIDPIAESPSANLFFGMMALVAQFERERIAERISEGKAAKKARGGCIGAIPFGFRKEGHGSKSMLVPDEKEQEHIRFATSRRLGLHPLRKISEEMAGQGMIGRDGKPYNVMAIQRMYRTGRKELAQIDDSVQDVGWTDTEAGNAVHG